MAEKNIIRDRRLELGLTYEELGKMVGVGKSTVRKWETGMIENIKRDNIVSLSKALGISPALIMGWDIENTNTNTNTNNNLSKEETMLLDNYNRLNSKGKEKLLDYSDDLTNNIKYMKNVNEISATLNVAEEPATYGSKPEITFDDFNTIAAHNDDLTDDEITEVNRRILEDLNRRNK